MTTQTKSEKDRVVIFDTTLRDGEQCPGATMTHEEKLEVAELLDDMGVDIIEAGFPIASEGDFAAVQEIAQRSKKAVICGLSRAAFKDIDRCAEAIKPARRKRIHTFISTSPVHMKYKLQKEPHEVYEMVIAAGRRARAAIRTTSNGRRRTPPAPSTIFSAAAWRRRSMPVPRRSISPTRSATRCRRNISRSLRCCARACRTPTRRASRPTATTISAWRWPIRSKGSRRARGRSNAPSTASASVRAMPRSKKS